MTAAHDARSPIYGFSSTADFDPADEPEGFITWTFAVPKSGNIGPGLYELRFVRNLTQDEINNGVRPQDAVPRECVALASQSIGEGVSRPDPQTPEASQ